MAGGDGWAPSALNVETTARWRACEDGDGHDPTGEAVDRQTSGGGLLRACSRCGVPVKPPPQASRFQDRHQAEREREERAARRAAAPARVPAAQRPCNIKGCDRPRLTLGSGYTLTRCREHELAAKREASQRYTQRRQQRPTGCIEPGCEAPRWRLGSGAVVSRCQEHERERSRRRSERRRSDRPKAAGPRKLPGGMLACARCGLWPRQREGLTYCIACARQVQREGRARRAARGERHDPLTASPGEAS